MADIRFADSPATIERYDKQYRATVAGIYTENSDKNTEALLMDEVVTPNLPANVATALSTMDASMAEEFAAPFQAMALGDSGTTTQGLALVNIGGLTAATILALLMLPAYDSLMNGGGKKRRIISD